MSDQVGNQNVGFLMTRLKWLLKTTYAPSEDSDHPGTTHSLISFLSIFTNCIAKEKLCPCEKGRLVSDLDNAHAEGTELYDLFAYLFKEVRCQ